MEGVFDIIRMKSEYKKQETENNLPFYNGEFKEFIDFCFTFFSSILFPQNWVTFLSAHFTLFTAKSLLDAMSGLVGLASITIPPLAILGYAIDAVNVDIDKDMKPGDYYVTVTEMPIDNIRYSFVANVTSDGKIRSLGPNRQKLDY